MWPGDSGLPGLRCGLALWASGFPDESVVARTEARFPPRAATSQKHPASWAQRPRRPAPPRAAPPSALGGSKAVQSPRFAARGAGLGNAAPARGVSADGRQGAGDTRRSVPGLAPRPRTPPPGSSTRSQSQGRFRTRRVAPCCGSPRIASGRAADPLLTLQPGFHPLPALALKGGSGVGNTERETFVSVVTLGTLCRRQISMPLQRNDQ